MEISLLTNGGILITQAPQIVTFNTARHWSNSILADTKKCIANSSLERFLANGPEVQHP
jgi:hypothetical protein